MGKTEHFVGPPLLGSLVRGSRFAIERSSGRLTGPEKSLWSHSDSNFSVLAPGTFENAFVAMATTQPKGIGLHVTLVVVEEFIA